MNDSHIKYYIHSLNEEISQLEVKLGFLRGIRKIAQRELDKKTYSCACVKLNSSINIYDCQAQHQRNRNPLSVGDLVADTLTADKACLLCKGTGKLDNETDL